MANLSKRAVVALLFIGVVGNTSWAQGFTSERPRKLAPGVITVIRDANIDDAAVDQTREFTELTSVVKPPVWTPNFDPTTETLSELAKKVSFQRDVWTLELGFKTLRVINVGGQDIYYLIYYVRNNGEVRSPSTKGTTIEITGKPKPVRYVPSFVLQSHDLKRAYRESFRPDVVSMIAAKERVTRGVLHDSFSVKQADIPVSTPTADRRVWCVATFDNVDPRADYLSVFVGGLTNAYRWEPPAGGVYKPNQPAIEQDRVKSKILQLNFWRGGDSVDLNDNEMEYGIPIYSDDPGRQKKVLETYKIDRPITHRWIYR